MTSKERRAWLKRICDYPKSHTYVTDPDTVAKIALTEISELDDIIKSLENKLSKIHPLSQHELNLRKLQK